MFDLMLNFDRLIIFIMNHYKDQLLVRAGNFNLLCRIPRVVRQRSFVLKLGTGPSICRNQEWKRRSKMRQMRSWGINTRSWPSLQACRTWLTRWSSESQFRIRSGRDSYRSTEIISTPFTLTSTSASTTGSHGAWAKSMQESKPVSNRDRPLMKKLQVGSKLIRLTMMHPHPKRRPVNHKKSKRKRRGVNSTSPSSASVFRDRRRAPGFPSKTTSASTGQKRPPRRSPTPGRLHWVLSSSRAWFPLHRISSAASLLRRDWWKNLRKTTRHSPNSWWGWKKPMPIWTTTTFPRPWIPASESAQDIRPGL